jgi:putative RNA 2'-phosphotransferase
VRQPQRALVLDVVVTNDKQRFAVSDDGQRIRAVQGHSTASVAIERPAAVPPGTLFHGMAARFLDAILREGLRPGQRHHVHLSADPATAQGVGARYGRPVVLRVDAAGMLAEGVTFHQAENGVWLCERVPPRFLEVPPPG